MADLKTKGNLLKITTTAGLNVRAWPSTSADIIAKIPQNSIVISLGQSVVVDKYTWALVIAASQYPSTLAGLTVGWIAAVSNLGQDWVVDSKSTTPPPVTLPPEPRATQNKMGWHVCSDGPLSDEAWMIIAECAQASKPVPLMLFVNDRAAPDRVKKISPATVTVLRNWPDKPDAEGYLNIPDGWYDRQMGAMRGTPGVDYFSLSCEWGYELTKTKEGCQTLSNFWSRLIDRANADGVKITILDFAVGWLEDKNFPSYFNGFEALRPLLQKAAQYGHPVLAHPYAGPVNVYNPCDAPELYAGRWIPWLKEIPGLKFIGGECGPYDGKDSSGQDAHFLGVDNFLFQLDCYDQLIRNSGVADRVIGMAYWTLGTGNGMWKRFDFSPALQAYKKWVLNHA